MLIKVSFNHSAEKETSSIRIYYSGFAKNLNINNKSNGNPQPDTSYAARESGMNFWLQCQDPADSESWPQTNPRSNTNGRQTECSNSLCVTLGSKSVNFFGVSKVGIFDANALKMCNSNISWNSFMVEWRLVADTLSKHSSATYM